MLQHVGAVLLREFNLAGCVRVCGCECVHVCTCENVWECVCVRATLCVLVRLHVLVRLLVRVCVRVLVHVCLRVCAIRCVHMCVVVDQSVECHKLKAGYGKYGRLIVVLIWLLCRTHVVHIVVMLLHLLR